MSVRHHIAYDKDGARLVLRKLPWWFRALDRAYWVVDRISGHRLCIHDAFRWQAWEDRVAVDHLVPLADAAAGHAVVKFLWGYSTEDGE